MPYRCSVCGSGRVENHIMCMHPNCRDGRDDPMFQPYRGAPVYRPQAWMIAVGAILWAMALGFVYMLVHAVAH